ncbi:MAG: threonine synthase [Desulfovibrio sp.]|jgi:threonine synthase|nr:threonine synthase [Desulfovibrio sp.]
MPKKLPPTVKALRCTICGREYAPDEVAYVCPDHGNEGILDVVYDYAAVKARLSPESLAANRDNTMWRYRPLLPVADDTPVPPLPVGWTPLIRAPRIAKLGGVAEVFLKDDSRQPTGSFKDRASALAVMKAHEANASIITTASTGNAAAALSGMCAAAAAKCVIFVPQSAPPAKIAQLLAYGAKVYLVRGNYDSAFDLCMQAAAEYGWYNRNTGYNPYMAEGKKTAALEICEQLGWKAPDKVFVGVGDGCIISGLHKGFKDLFALGWIDRVPALMGVQAEGSDFMYQTWKQKADPLTFPPINAETAADSISACLPRDRIKASAAILETGGAWLRVCDARILSAIPLLAANSGVFAEPAAAASLAGLLKAKEEGRIAPTDTVALVVTGSGLKDVAAAMKACEDARSATVTVEPSLADVRRTAGELFTK